MIATLDQIGSSTIHPVEAEHGAGTVSNRYGFISTRTLLDSLATEGFAARSIRVARTTKQERQGFQRHVVRLQHADLMPMQKDEYRPEIVLTNSHDATCSLRLTLGIYRLVCTNGLVVGETMFTERFVHRQINVDRVNEAAIALSKKIPMMADRVNQMKERVLTPVEATRFVREAVELRYTEEKKINEVTFAMGRARRYEDGTMNLWQVFNRVQENMIQGTRGVRRVTSAARDFWINKHLWNLATTFLNN